MTCTADGFGLNVVRRGNKQSSAVNPGFERDQDFHNVFFQMCGSKQKISHLTFENLSDQRNAETAFKAKFDLKIAVSKDKIKKNNQFSVKTGDNETLLPSGQAALPCKSKHEPIHKETSSVPACLDLTSSSTRWPVSCVLKLPAEVHHPVSLRESPEQGSLMFAQSGNLTSGQKRCRTDRNAGASDPKRRKPEDNNKQPESMAVTYRKLSAPFCKYGNPREVAHHPYNNPFREVTYPVFSPFLLTDSLLLSNSVCPSAAQRCKTSRRKQRTEDIMEYTCADTEIIKRDIQVFHNAVQQLLVKCISLQKKRCSVYIPSWKDTTIRIHDTKCGRYRVDNQNTSACNAAGRSCQTDKQQQPTHNGVSYQSLQQLHNDATVKDIRSQHRIRSQVQAMRQHWLGLPRKYQHRLELSRRFILVLDKHLRVIFVSENVSRHLGYQQDDMLGGSIGQFIHPKHLSEMSRLTRGGHFQTDDKPGVPIWKTGKVITVAMRFCVQNTRTGLQDTGYKPVLWTVNLRLKKRGHCLRAQDMVILCKPMHDCTVTSLQMGRRNMLISPCNPSFNFHFCNFSCDLAERTVHHKANNFSGMQHLCSDTESHLLNMNHHEFNYLRNISHSYLREPDCDLSSNQLGQSCPLNGHVCSSCIPQWWTAMDETTDNSYHSSVANSNGSLTLQPSKCVCTNKSIRSFCNNISACSTSCGVGRMCPFGAACTNNFIMASPSIHEDVKTHVGIKLFADRSGKSLNPDHKCVLPSKLPSANIYCLNQTSPFVDSFRPCILKKAFTDHKTVPTDELTSDEADISDDSKSIYEDVIDVEFPELVTESEPESPSKTSVHDSFSFVCAHNPAQSLTGNKHQDQPLPASLQLQLDFKTENNLQLLSCQEKSDAKNSCSLPQNITSGNFSKTDSSSLSFMENISPVLVRKKINEDVSMQTCSTVGSFDGTARANQTVKKRSNTLLHNFLLDLAKMPAKDSTTLCNSMSPFRHTSQSKSSDVHHHQVSSASSISCSLACSWCPATNHMVSSTAASADDNSPVKGTHSQGKSTSNITNTSLLTESAVEQIGNLNQVHSVSYKMTNQKYDPFLSQASFSDFNSFPNTDMFDDLSSVTCPVTAQIEQMSDQDAQSHFKDQFSSSNFQTFLDPAPESTSFASESLSDLDSLLNTIPMSHVANAQTTLFPGWPESDTSQSSDSMSLSNYFFSKDIGSKPSLLRKLLDKEGSAVQEPDGDIAWKLDQIPEKNIDLKKPRIHCGSTKLRHSVGKQANNYKSLVRSVEIPKSKLNPRQMMQFNKYKPQYQKPTKELPLPLSIKAAGTSPSCELLQHDADANGVASPENLEKQLRKCTESRSLDPSANCELPDDLIDMAVECCTPLEMDQTDALISDLNDSCSWEDNLYSLLESSGQDNSGSNSDGESPQQTSEKFITSKHPTVTSELLSSFFHSKDSFSIPSSASSSIAESSFLYHTQPNKETPKSSSCQTSLPPQQKNVSLQVNKTSSCGSSIPSQSTPSCSNTAGRMSLLRAAITSDVDKLIEQIPLRNARKPPCTLHRTSEEEDNDPDILITKVMGLSSHRKHHHKVNKIKTASKARPSENISLFKALQSSRTTVTASRNVMSPSYVQTSTTSVPRKSCDKWQLLQNSPSCEHCGNASKTPPIINPLVIKISIGSSSPPTVICSKRGSHNNFSQHIKPDSLNKVFDKSPNPSFPRAQKSSSSDLSSTQPVSVMIMRKENHRSRRSKSIAIQTDNEPGEVYPEFEHNPSDTVLYPSTIITYTSAASSPQDLSPLSTTPSSQSSNLSETDKFLPSHPSTDDSSSSADGDYRTISSTPFLFKLLTGELSKDHYQRLDQQMMDKERRKSSLH